MLRTLAGADHTKKTHQLFGWNEEMKAAAAQLEPLQGMDLR